MQLLRFWREILILGLVAALGVVYIYRPDCEQSSTSTPVSVPVLKEEEVKNKVTRITKKPSGEVVEEVSESEVSLKEKSKVGVATSNTSHKSKYSIGLHVNPLDYRHVKADASARLGDLPLHVVGGYDFKHTEASMGLRYDF